ncbi:MAG: hypothetical protein Greene041614_1064 [Parcubacteria group bacterium Greene0416_14]|nr:MAG: hypothetical protein Greene041614_1064 [Parcubacteria group bacterium Greene0416_14]TSC99892.1 MAG: hypothetical protein Greene101415_1042 [Parcubacteria group bacterium Greene1014_15]
MRTRTDGDAHKSCIGGGRFLFQQKSHGLLREYPVVSVRKPTGIDGADFFIRKLDLLRAIPIIPSTFLCVEEGLFGTLTMSRKFMRTAQGAVFVDFQK